MFVKLHWGELTYQEQEYFCEAFIEKSKNERAMSYQIDKENYPMNIESEVKE